MRLMPKASTTSAAISITTLPLFKEEVHVGGGSFYATRVAVKFALLKVKSTPSEITHVISRPHKQRDNNLADSLLTPPREELEAEGLQTEEKFKYPTLSRQCACNLFLHCFRGGVRRTEGYLAEEQFHVMPCRPQLASVVKGKTAIQPHFFQQIIQSLQTITCSASQLLFNAYQLIILGSTVAAAH